MRTLCAMLDTGCRESELLEVSPERVDLTGRCIVFRTLKKRRGCVYRAVPVPPSTLDHLDLVHRVRDAVRRGKGHAALPLWPCSRMREHEVMIAAGIPDGPHRCPKGPAARLRRPRHRQRCPPQHAQQVDGSRQHGGDGDLRQRPRGRGAGDRGAYVVIRGEAVRRQKCQRRGHDAFYRRVLVRERALQS